MNEVLVATLGGIGALLFWGTSDWLTSLSSKRYSSSVTNLSIQLINGLSLLLVLVLSGVTWPSLAEILVIVATALLFTAAYLCFIKALAVGRAGVVVPLANTYPLVALLLTLLFLSAVFSVLQLVAMIVIVVGAMLLGAEKMAANDRRRLSKEVVFACLTALFWGAGFFTISTVVDTVAWQAVVGIMALAMACLAIIIFAVQNGRRTLHLLPQVAQNKIGLGAGLLLGVGSVPFYMATEISGNIIIPTVIASGSPLATSFLAYLFQKERLGIAKRAGAVLAVLGVILLNL